MSSLVFLAPMIPATLATCRTSPFDVLFSFTNLKASWLSRTRPWAVARLKVGGLWEMSTILALPVTSTCVRDGFVENRLRQLWQVETIVLKN